MSNTVSGELNSGTDRKGRHSPKAGPVYSTGNPPGTVVGIIEVKAPADPQEFNPLRVAWVVNPLRRDKRTGADNRQPASEYAQELFDCVSLGVPLPRSTREEPVFIHSAPAEDEQTEDQPTEDHDITAGTEIYVLQYTARRGTKYSRAQFKRIIADNDRQAAHYARSFLERRGIPDEWLKEAELFLDERAIDIWTEPKRSADSGQ